MSGSRDKVMNFKKLTPEKVKNIEECGTSMSRKSSVTTDLPEKISFIRKSFEEIEKQLKYRQRVKEPRQMSDERRYQLINRYYGKNTDSEDETITTNKQIISEKMAYNSKHSKYIEGHAKYFNVALRHAPNKRRDELLKRFYGNNSDSDDEPTARNYRKPDDLLKMAKQEVINEHDSNCSSNSAASVDNDEYQ